jgi:hypothetical protein
MNVGNARKTTDAGTGRDTKLVDGLEADSSQNRPAAREPGLRPQGQSLKI